MPDITPTEIDRGIVENPWSIKATAAKEIREKARPVNYTEIVGVNRVIFLAENHSNTPIRRHIARRADQLKAAGITHYAIEASDTGKEVFDRLNQGENADLSRVDVGPGRSDYEDAIYAMHAAGIAVVPVDIDQTTKPTQEEREAHITANIDRILDADPNAKVAVLIGGFHSSRRTSGQDFSYTGKRLMDKGIPTVNVHFAGGEVASPTIITKPAREAGKASDEFMLDMNPYQNLDGVPYGKGESDYIIHLPQAMDSYSAAVGFGNSQFFDIDLTSFKPLKRG